MVSSAGALFAASAMVVLVATTTTTTTTIIAGRGVVAAAFIPPSGRRSISSPSSSSWTSSSTSAEFLLDVTKKTTTKAMTTTCSSSGSRLYNSPGDSSSDDNDTRKKKSGGKNDGGGVGDENVIWTSDFDDYAGSFKMDEEEDGGDAKVGTTPYFDDDDEYQLSKIFQDNSNDEENVSNVDADRNRKSAAAAAAADGVGNRAEAKGANPVARDDDDDVGSVILPLPVIGAASSSGSSSSSASSSEESGASSYTPPDVSACKSRQFSLGQDLVLSDFVGNMGFDEVTDWEYYYQDEDDEENGGGGGGRGAGGVGLGNSGTSSRRVVQPNPFDPSQPRRTRTSSGSVIRIFRGEFVGQIGGTLSSKGLDRRVLVKEYNGPMALSLARAELNTVSTLQAKLLIQKNNKNNRKRNRNKKGDDDDDDNDVDMEAADELYRDWYKAASARSVMLRRDNAHVSELIGELRSSPFVGLLGEVDLAELDGDMDPNEFYRALGVPPPKSDAIWIAYEYAGLATSQTYSSAPAEVRRSRVPPERGFFGNVIEPPPLPSWDDRAKYVVGGILRQTLEAVSNLHDAGIVHRSLGRSSIVLSSKEMDKRMVSSPYATVSSTANKLVVKLSDFGFSCRYDDGPRCVDEEFCSRARSFGLSFREGSASIQSANFAVAEDMHALGFVFLGLLLTSLAEVPSWKTIGGPDAIASAVPNTDEDTLQRLLGDIFDKDVTGQFRDYVDAEECWVDLVSLLDARDGAGWKVLESLVLARENVARNIREGELSATKRIVSVSDLLSSPFFN